ncbi:MAG: PEP-CTERM sorting domain-containing protein [Novosphingobium sp.]|nr:PEP-CTERM sorting domain-containing protein [Novosphingobium sp.]
MDVPEPGMLILFGAAAAALVARQRYGARCAYSMAAQ